MFYRVSQGELSKDTRYANDAIRMAREALQGKPAWYRAQVFRVVPLPLGCELLIHFRSYVIDDRGIVQKGRYL